MSTDRLLKIEHGIERIKAQLSAIGDIAYSGPNWIALGIEHSKLAIKRTPRQ